MEAHSTKLMSVRDIYKTIQTKKLRQHEENNAVAGPYHLLTLGVGSVGYTVGIEPFWVFPGNDDYCAAPGLQVFDGQAREALVAADGRDFRHLVYYLIW